MLLLASPTVQISAARESGAVPIGTRSLGFSLAALIAFSRASLYHSFRTTDLCTSCWAGIAVINCTMYGTALGTHYVLKLHDTSLANGANIS